jgi:transcriptional regulator with XRE-family HTH domain
MDIGARIKDPRAAKHLSQGDMEKRTGLLRRMKARVLDLLMTMAQRMVQKK